MANKPRRLRKLKVMSYELLLKPHHNYRGIRINYTHNTDPVALNQWTTSDKANTILVNPHRDEN